MHSRRGLTSELRGFGFDLDGCIWAGAVLLPGARELVATLRGDGRSVVFVTNSSRERAAQIADRLTRLGIPAGSEDVLAALDLLGETIRRRLGPATVLPLGTREMREVLEAAGHRVVGLNDWREAQAVAVGNDPAFDFARLRAASRAVAAGAVLFTVNLDARLPVAPGEWDPGCGALTEAVAVAGGARPVVVGKPYSPIFERALERLKCRPPEAAMVGDSLTTDIAGGRAAGMVTVWVDSVGDRRGDGPADVVVGSLVELLESWRAASR
jgi:HAD superfamily hydrolase (TIGR01450 family)